MWKVKDVDPDRIWLMDPDPGGQKDADPNPDPQHW